jgi:acetyl-CoA C-acetyltransferase
VTGPTGLTGEASIVGLVELPPERKQRGRPLLSIEQCAVLAKGALDDAGLGGGVVDGIVVAARINESTKFVPATVVEYLGLEVNFAEFMDIGGANAAGGVARAAIAVELGLCEAVLVVTPGAPGYTPRSRTRPSEPDWVGASSNAYGSPQAEFEIPIGVLGQNVGYAQIARRYAATYGYDERAMAQIAVAQRVNASHVPDAVFFDQPISVDDVLSSPMVADPLHLLEMVMPCQGGAAVLVASARLAAKSRHRPVTVRGYGERVSYKSPTYAEDLLASPIRPAADKAFAMARVERSEVDMVSLYDCYTITVLMMLEEAGFCEKGKGLSFVMEHDLTFRGDFPLNTWGGQLSFGQAGAAGGMHHVCDATRQIMCRAGATQLGSCDTAFVTGNGGIMSEQVALVLQGA